MDSTAAFAQLQWRLVDQTPWRYEVIRPLVLFADRTATQHAGQRQDDLGCGQAISDPGMKHRVIPKDHPVSLLNVSETASPQMER